VGLEDQTQCAFTSFLQKGIARFRVSFKWGGVRRTKIDTEPVNITILIDIPIYKCYYFVYWFLILCKNIYIQTRPYKILMVELSELVKIEELGFQQGFGRVLNSVTESQSKKALEYLFDQFEGGVDLVQLEAIFEQVRSEQFRFDAYELPSGIRFFLPLDRITRKPIFTPGADPGSLYRYNQQLGIRKDIVKFEDGHFWRTPDWREVIEEGIDWSPIRLTNGFILESEAIKLKFQRLVGDFKFKKLLYLIRNGRTYVITECELEKSLPEQGSLFKAEYRIVLLGYNNEYKVNKLEIKFSRRNGEDGQVNWQRLELKLKDSGRYACQGSFGIVGREEALLRGSINEQGRVNGVCSLGNYLPEDTRKSVIPRERVDFIRPLKYSMELLCKGSVANEDYEHVKKELLFRN